MTLPTNITLPLDPTLIKSANPQQLYEYLRKLVYVLGTLIQQSNESANGTINSIDETTTPGYLYVQGSVTAGTATYVSPQLWARRSNLITMIWFDITWTNHTGTGDTQIVMPYFSQPSNGFPYVGVIESDNMTYTAGYTYLTGNLTPNTNTMQVNQNGSGVPLIALPLAADGHLRGSILYVGQQFQ